MRRRRMANFGLRKNPPRNSDSLSSEFHSRCKKVTDRQILLNPSLPSNRISWMVLIYSNFCFRKIPFVFCFGFGCVTSHGSGWRLAKAKKCDSLVFVSYTTSKGRFIWVLYLLKWEDRQVKITSLGFKVNKIVRTSVQQGKTRMVIVYTSELCNCATKNSSHGVTRCERQPK